MNVLLFALRRAALQSVLVAMLLPGLLVSQTDSLADLRRDAAEGVRVRRVRALSATDCYPCAPVFSPSDSLLLFIAHDSTSTALQPRSQVRIVDVRTARVVRRVSLDRAARLAAWSPDSRQIVVVDAQGASAVIETATGRETKLGPFPGGLELQEVLWSSPTTVWFFRTGSWTRMSSRVDLVTLAEERLGLDGRALGRLADSLRWDGSAGPSISASVYDFRLQLRNRDSSFTQRVQSVTADGVVSASRRGFLAITNRDGPGRNRLDLVELVRTDPLVLAVRGRWLAGAPFAKDRAQLDALHRALSEGGAVYSLARRPRLNPLNGLFIGTEGDPVAVVRITSADDSTVTGRITMLIESQIGRVLLSNLWVDTFARMPRPMVPGGSVTFRLSALVDGSGAARIER